MQLLAVAVLLAAVTVPPAAAPQPVRLFVFARPQETLSEPERKAREKETGAELKRAEEARKTLRKALEARHGKNGQGWPDEARRELERAQQAEYTALLAHHEVKVEAEVLRNLADTLGKTILDVDKKTSRLALAGSAEQSDVSVEVLTRRAKTSFPAAAWFLYVKVKPERLAGVAGRTASFGQVKDRSAWLGQIMGNQRLQGAVTTMHDYSESEPYWIVEVVQQGTSYGPVVQSTAEVLAAFASGLAEPASANAAADTKR